MTVIAKTRALWSISGPVDSTSEFRGDAGSLSLTTGQMVPTDYLVERARAHVLVTGIVQGVFFRARTRQLAESLRLTGFARNLPDGRVEAVFEGKKPQVEQMVAWCRHGPPHAEVTDITVTWEEPTGEFPDFAIRYL